MTHEQVRYIAELAKLDLTDDEVSLFADQFGAILDYFEHLREVDTSNVPLTASVLPLQNVLRDDTAGTPLTPEEAVANAPDALHDQFRVRAVLEE